MRSINCAGEKSNNNNTSDSGGKLLVKLLPCLSNGCGVLHLVSSKSRTHYSIALTFSVVQLESTFIERMPCFFRGTTRINVYQKNALSFINIWRSLEIKYSFKKWLNDNSWCDIFTDFSKAAETQEKMRYYFEDSFNMNFNSSRTRGNTPASMVSFLCYKSLELGLDQVMIYFLKNVAFTVFWTYHHC